MLSCCDRSLCRIRPVDAERRAHPGDAANRRARMVRQSGPGFGVTPTGEPFLRDVIDHLQPASCHKKQPTAAPAWPQDLDELFQCTGRPTALGRTFPLMARATRW